TAFAPVQPTTTFCPIRTNCTCKLGSVMLKAFSVRSHPARSTNAARNGFVLGKPWYIWANRSWWEYELCRVHIAWSIVSRYQTAPNSYSANFHHLEWTGLWDSAFHLRITRSL